MELTFSHLGYQGRVSVLVEKTVDPAILGAWEGAQDLANCTATIDFDGHGYLQRFGWVQLVRSTDNAFQGEAFEIDPFDPFGLYERAPTPYCWYGTLPTLFDAPSRDERVRLDWLAHSFLAVSPLRGNRRIVTPLLGFRWGFHIADDGTVTLEDVAALPAAHWSLHLPYLRDIYPEWQFTEMAIARDGG
jgi:hypothetical protein